MKVRSCCQQQRSKSREDLCTISYYWPQRPASQYLLVGLGLMLPFPIQLRTLPQPSRPRLGWAGTDRSRESEGWSFTANERRLSVLHRNLSLWWMMDEWSPGETGFRASLWQFRLLPRPKMSLPRDTPPNIGLNTSEYWKSYATIPR